MLSLPSLLNVLALLLLVFFIYSVLAVFIFSDVVEGRIVDPYNNFNNFGAAMLTLCSDALQVRTGTLSCSTRCTRRYVRTAQQTADSVNIQLLAV